jgi:dGTPase
VDAAGNRRRKYSCYAEDLEVFTWVREGAPDGRRAMEAQVMDWADDVAYSVHDVEDGILSGRITLGVLWDLVELAALAEKGAAAFGGDPAELLEAADRLREMDLVARAADFRGGLQDLVSLKALTSELVSRYVTAVVTATRAAYPGTGGLGRYSAELVIPAPVVAEVTLLKSVAVLYVMDEKRHLANQDRQRDRIYRVAGYLTAGAPGTLDPVFRAWWTEADSDSDRQRVIVDQVASYTESRLERVDRLARAESAAWG